jgi:hypothetical protein
MARPIGCSFLLATTLALTTLLAGGCGDRKTGTQQDAAVQRDGPGDKDGAADLTPLDQRPADAPRIDGARPDAPPVDGPRPDALRVDGPRPDALPLDGPLLDGPPPKCGPFKGTIGKVCASVAACGAGYTCLLGLYGSAGLCSQACIPDNPNTPANEDSCPAGNVCGKYGNLNYCFRECAPQLGCSECDGPVSCHPSSGQYIGRRLKAVCLYGRCSSGADCPVTTGAPCKTNAPACGTGETCTALATNTTDGVCTKPGVCDLASGLCAPHKLGKATAKVGDPCKGDVDCGDAMYCLMEYDESKYLKAGGVACTANDECCSGSCALGTCANGPCVVRARNGYCTVLGCSHAATFTERACPSGSECNRLYAGGLCQKSCAMGQASDCRGHSADLLGDYECRAWNRVQITWTDYATQAPVCDVGTYLPCNSFFGSQQDCTAVGNVGNTTNMACRDLNNIVLTNKYDANGFCLDDTASGTKTP